MTTHEIMEDVEEADRDREAGPVLQFLAATVRLIISVAITLLGLVTLTFFISRLLPLDPVIAMLGDNVSQEAYDTMYRKSRPAVDRAIRPIPQECAYV